MESIVYMFLNSNKEILYIGKTTSINQRMSQHFNDNEMLNIQWKKEIKYIRIYNFSNPIDMSIYEIYWINKYNPPHNKADNYKGYESELYLPDISNIYEELNIDYIQTKNKITNFNLPLINNKTINFIVVSSNVNKKLLLCKDNYQDFPDDEDKIRRDLMNVYRNKINVKQRKYIFEYNCSLSSKKYLVKHNTTLKDKKTLIYLGFKYLNNETEEHNILYNLNLIINMINEMESDVIDVYIQSNKLRERLENYYFSK
jgi:hypothetical protein